MKLKKLKIKKAFLLISLAIILIAVVVTFTVRQDNQDIQVPDTTQQTQVADADVTEPTVEVEKSTEEASLEDADEPEPESTEKATSNSKVEPSTVNKTSTTKETTTISSNNSPTKPQFDYIDTITTYDGQTLYKVYDETYGEYYYCAEDGIRRYTEEAALDLVRPSKQEIYSNPISKVTVEGVTWYKYQTGNGKYRYLASDGRDIPGIEISIPTNGKDSITVSGVTFYKTYSSDGQYEYYDSQGNYLIYDGSYCHRCGKSAEVCYSSMSGYYCVVCEKDIPALTCHAKAHHDVSK